VLWTCIEWRRLVPWIFAKSAGFSAVFDRIGQSHRRFQI
jgi:hypothetical protein